MLESGALRWTTVSQERLKCLAHFSRWLDERPGDSLSRPMARTWNSGGCSPAVNRSNDMTCENAVLTS
jgi:hypothetical protein